jgi:hypothetical protein
MGIMGIMGIISTRYTYVCDFQSYARVTLYIAVITALTALTAHFLGRHFRGLIPSNLSPPRIRGRNDMMTASAQNTGCHSLRASRAR